MSTDKQYQTNIEVEKMMVILVIGILFFLSLRLIKPIHRDDRVVSNYFVMDSAKNMGNTQELVVTTNKDVVMSVFSEKRESYEKSLQRKPVVNSYQRVFNVSGFLGITTLHMILEGRPNSWEPVSFTFESGKRNSEGMTKVKLDENGHFERLVRVWVGKTWYDIEVI